MTAYDGSNSDIQQVQKGRRLKKTIKITRPGHPKVTKKKTLELWKELKKKDPKNQYFILPDLDKITMKQKTEDQQQQQVQSYQMQKFKEGKTLSEVLISLIQEEDDTQKVITTKKNILKHLPQLFIALRLMNQVGYHNDISFRGPGGLTNILFDPDHGFRIIDFDTFTDKQSSRLTQEDKKEEHAVTFILTIIRKVFNIKLDDANYNELIKPYLQYDYKEFETALKTQIIPSLKQKLANDEFETALKTDITPSSKKKMVALFTGFLTVIAGGIGVLSYFVLTKKWKTR